MKRIIYEVEEAIATSIKDDILYSWREDTVVLNILKSLRRLLSNKQLNYPLETTSINFRLFHYFGSEETKFGDIALIVNRSFPNGDSIKGAGFIEAKIRNKEKLNFEAFRKSQLIVKNLGNLGAFTDPETGKQPVATYTRTITTKEIESLPEKFNMVLVQQKIFKELELRVFHFNGKNYPMAIFSQLEESSSEDFRIYKSGMKQRWVPFDLPKSISSKINLLMKKLELDSGSLDLIVSTEGEYYFLEVNPDGQFGMVSGPCNYYLEKMIAEKLVEYEKG